MEFLLDCKLNNQDIIDIVNNNSEEVINNIKLSKNNCIEVINYLYDIGITKETIYQLFMRQIGIFHRTKKEIEQVFDEYEIESIVNSLNFDVNTIDMIEF